MFGGPWYFMNQLSAFTNAETSFAQTEIKAYKQIPEPHRHRNRVSSHLAPATGLVDGLESLTPADGNRSCSGGAGRFGLPSSIDIPMQGLTPNKTYTVTFQTDRQIFSMTGAQLAQPGVSA